MHILVFETEELGESVLEDICRLLSEKSGFQVMRLPGSAECPDCLEPLVLSFSDLEIHIWEQTVYESGSLIPMSHYEFFTLCYLTKHHSWVSSDSKFTRLSGEN